MSIIEEALRRNQGDSGEPPAGKADPAAVIAAMRAAKSTAAPQAQRGTQRRSSAPALTAALIVLAVFGASLLVRFTLAKSPSVVPARPAIASAAVSPPAVATPLSAPAATVPVAPRFTVSGVMLSQGEAPLAIINGRIVAAGDTVDGAAVVRIEPQRVVLRDTDGQELFMAVAR